MNKALIITSVASMVDQFLLPSLFLLQEMEYDVHVACNFEKGNTCSAEQVEELKRTLIDHEITFYQVDFERNVLQLFHNVQAYKQISTIITTHEFSLIHCHSPIGGLLGRLAARNARNKGTSVFYTAHGFHFYKGAPLKNWLFYYRVEKFCSRFTDKLITINQEDYELAKRKFHAKETHYMPGVGVDLGRFENVRVDKPTKRREIGVPEDAILLLSVGELNENKNHQIIIRALAELNHPNVHYAIAGVGEKKEYLICLADKLGISDKIHLLGYRKDVAEIYKISDIYVLPSVREGLNVSLMEAMASKCPCLVSRIRGNIDLIDSNGGELFDPKSVMECVDKIRAMLGANHDNIGQYNSSKIRQFSLESVNVDVARIYRTK